MPSMNTGMQRRIGLLPKTEDLLDYQGHIFGNTHRGFEEGNQHPHKKDSSASAVLAWLTVMECPTLGTETIH